MPIELRTDEHATTLALAGVLDVRDATALHAAARTALATRRALLVDADGLVALERALADEGRSLTVEGVAPSVGHRLALAGLGAIRRALVLTAPSGLHILPPRS